MILPNLYWVSFVVLYFFRRKILKIINEELKAQKLLDSKNLDSRNLPKMYHPSPRLTNQSEFTRTYNDTSSSNEEDP